MEEDTEAIPLMEIEFGLDGNPTLFDDFPRPGEDFEEDFNNIEMNQCTDRDPEWNEFMDLVADLPNFPVHTH